MKRWLLSTVMAGLVTAGAQAATDDFDKMRKEINIMSNILSSTLKQQEHKTYRVGRIDATYLDNQGIVFTIGSASRRHRFGHGDFVMPEMPELPELPPVVEMGQFEIEGMSERDIERITEQAEAVFENYAESSRELVEARREQAERLRELREKQRDMAREVRDLERRKRDLQFEERHADDKNKNKYEEKLKKVEQRLAKAMEDERRFGSDVDTIRDKLKADKQARKQQLAQQKTSYYQGMQQLLADTLCDYGAGLKSLDKKENVTFILSNAGPRTRRGSQDRIYVFNKKDILSCVSGKGSAKKLLDKATSYHF